MESQPPTSHLLDPGAATSAGSRSSLSEKTKERTERMEGPGRSGGEVLAVEMSWNKNDQENPKEWSTAFKIWITIQMTFLSTIGTGGTSITSPAQATLASYANVSQEIAVLAISLYVIGFALGGVIWGPCSEIWGRRLGMIPAMYCLGIFAVATAVSTRIEAILITRFFGGVFGAAPTSNASAVLGDIWDTRVRGTAMTFYSIAMIAGPTIMPVIGAAAMVTRGARWTSYTLAIMSFAIAIICTIGFPETYEPVLLTRRVRLLRESSDVEIYHPHEHLRLSVSTVLTKYLTRPLRILFRDPICLCISGYASFIFALLYISLEVFPIVFQEHRHANSLVGSLPFLAVFVGTFAGIPVNLWNQGRYKKLCDAQGGRPVPEGRLIPMAIGAFLLPIGLLWFGWTATPASIPWEVPIFGAMFIGAAFTVIFQQCVNYLIDTYGVYAASAVSANTFLRSIAAAGFPLFARPMFHNLGIGPAMSIFGGIAVLAIPIPFLLMKYSPRLRRSSVWAANLSPP